MPGNIDIINRALSKLGERRISSIDDDCKAAGEAAAMYETVRDSEIAAHRWGFAQKRVMLPAEAETPPFGFARAYLLPADCLRVLEAGPWPQPNLSGYVGGGDQPYSLEGGRILTNQSPPLSLLYLASISDAAMYPAPFIEVLACRLALELAESLTGSQSKRELAWKEYERMLARAKRWGAIQLPPQTPQDNSWLLARL